MLPAAVAGLPALPLPYAPSPCVAQPTVSTGGGGRQGLYKCACAYRYTYARWCRRTANLPATTPAAAHHHPWAAQLHGPCIGCGPVRWHGRFKADAAAHGAQLATCLSPAWRLAGSGAKYPRLETATVALDGNRHGLQAGPPLAHARERRRPDKPVTRVVPRGTRTP